MIARHFLYSTMRHQRGLSLIELLIGIALSLLILTAVLYSFAGSRASYMHQASFSAVQESGRIGLEVLNRDLRMMGNPGCGNLLALDHRSAPPVGNLNAAATFSNANVLRPVPGASATDPDAITVVYGRASKTSVVNSPADNQVEVFDLAPLGTLVAGDLLLLSDCVATEVLTVGSVSVGSKVITATGNLSQRFRTGSEVMRLESVTYALVGNELRRNGQAVAAGVTDLQLLYGVAGLAGRFANEYTDAPSAAAAERAVSVKLAFTVADGANVSQSFFSTVAFRNRAP
jgi:prepilin-type N-terminal cleavage/methylation domain-containing protein